MIHPFKGRCLIISWLADYPFRGSSQGTSLSEAGKWSGNSYGLAWFEWFLPLIFWRETRKSLEDPRCNWVIPTKSSIEVFQSKKSHNTKKSSHLFGTDLTIIPQQKKSVLCQSLSIPSPSMTLSVFFSIPPFFESSCDGCMGGCPDVPQRYMAVLWKTAKRPHATHVTHGTWGNHLQNTANHCI